MNAISSYERVMSYLDRSRTSRFTFNQINITFVMVQKKIVEFFKDQPDEVRKYLYTLKTDATPAVTTLQTTSDYIVSHINYPADYYYFQVMNVFIDGTLAEVTPTDDDQLNRQLQNTYTAPTNKYIFQREDATGWKVYRGTTGTPTCELTYLKTPSNFYMGNESNLIDDGVGVLAPFTNYTVVNQSEYNGVTYNPADTFTTNSTQDLTSGQVILTSILVDSNLPEQVQEKMCWVVAGILSGDISDFNKAMFVDKEVNKNIS
jgi:hypothetical protein